MAFARYELYIDHEKFGDHGSLKACWEILDDAYSRLKDPYGDELHWEIHDPFVGKRGCKFDMAGGIWDACCEDPNAFRMYLNLFGWEPL